MSSYDRSEVRAGILVLLVLLAAVAFAAGVGGSTVYELLSGGRVECETYFDAVGSLKTGAPVSVAGRRAGAVTEIELVVLGDDDLRSKLPDATGAGDGGVGARHLVRVAFLVDGELELNPETARVALAQDSLLGDKFLDLYPGYWTRADRAQPLAAQVDGAGAPLAIRSQPEASLLASVMPAVESFKKIADTLNAELLSESNMARIGTLLTELEHTIASVDRELDASNETGLGNATRQTLFAAESTLSSIDGVVQENRESVRTLVARLADASSRVDGLVDRVETSLTAVEGAAVALEDTTGERVGRELTMMLASLRRAADALGSLAETLERDADMLLKGRALEEAR